MAIVHREPFGDLDFLIVDADPNGIIMGDIGAIAFMADGSDVFQNINGTTAWHTKTLKTLGAQPGVAQDVDAGYAFGDIVANTLDGSQWLCTSAAAGAAVWVRTTYVVAIAGVPGATDDQTKGWFNGSIRVTDATAYACFDKSTGAAKWGVVYDVSGAVDFATSGNFRATYDFATDGGAVGSNPFGPELPANAYVLSAKAEVLTTLESPTGDAATVGLGVTADDTTGIVAAIAISDLSNPWDAAGLLDTLCDGTAAAATTKTTSRRRLNLEVGVEAITAGRLVIFGTYGTTE